MDTEFEQLLREWRAAALRFAEAERAFKYCSNGPEWEGLRQREVLARIEEQTARWRVEHAIARARVVSEAA